MPVHAEAAQTYYKTVKNSLWKGEVSQANAKRAEGVSEHPGYVKYIKLVLCQQFVTYLYLRMCSAHHGGSAWCVHVC